MEISINVQFFQHVLTKETLLSAIINHDDKVKKLKLVRM